MKVLRFLFKDWVFGILLTCTMLAAFSLEVYPLLRVENLAYDIMCRFSHGETPDNVVIVAIDDKSIKSVGSWPWPRTYVADMVSRLTSYGPKVIGLEILYPEMERNPGLEEIIKVSKDLRGKKNKTLKKIYRSLLDAGKRVDGDSKLMSSVGSSGRVVLPLLFTLGEPSGDTGKVPGLLKKNSIILDMPAGGFENIKADLLALRNPLLPLLNRELQAKNISLPFEKLSLKAHSLGHINQVADRDGTVRKVPLFINYGHRYYPSYALQLGLRYFNDTLASLEGLETSGGAWGLSFKKLEIPTDSRLRMITRYGDGNAPQRYSFSDVLEGTVPGKTFKGKVVLIGFTGTGTHLYGTPTGGTLSGVEITATAVENIIKGNSLIRPRWAFGLEMAVLAYFGIFVSFILPRVRLGVGALLTALSLLPILIISAILFFSFGYWVMLFSPSLLIILGFLAPLLREHVSVGNRHAAETEKIETNKMLGLSFQNQGMLDMAFEKFMKCPVKDKSVRELLYNLALDFERKRMPGKARAVYEHILKAGKFKDVKKRVEKLHGTSLPASGAPLREGTVLLDGFGANPTLGRYEVIKELGRGAMGMVFMGRDPKINREVAIKTLVYGEVEPGLIDKVKKRFFQEAEAAGRLSHPNIVTIYDAGEEHDMAFMAMELISGGDLSRYCRKDNLLPRLDVIRMMADVAEALDYAHKNGVIHRDIKPANIMLMEDGTVKVTDFGIARIVESSTTHTRMIQGTPSYMSPEQVNGERVEGPSDLFSLGAVFYELLSGKKAFRGENVSAVMYNIAKCDFIPLKKVAKKVPDRLEGVVKKLLTKSITRRYKSGAEVAKEIRTCLSK